MIARLVYNVHVVVLLIVGLSALCVFPTIGHAATEPPASTVTTPTPESLAPPSPTTSTAPSTTQIANQAAPVRQDATRPAYDWEAVLLVILILALLALLFYFLLKWSHRLDQASYLGEVYQESVEEFEYRRLATRPAEKLENEEYHQEIVRDSSWLKANPQPQPPPGVGISYDYLFFQSRSGRRLQSGGSSGGSSREISDEDRQARDNYQREINEWRNKVEAAASVRYRADLTEARTRARARAKLATDVDLSALRGRGAEFVLEFTTVVVIIFAAVILGVLRILGTEQIGTLLAAIAGYVLGRATTRTRAGAGEPVVGERPARVPGTVEGNRGENGNAPP